ncbi:MAG: flagellar export chaperone FliS [Firmicutes bacterium]|jgi:flagellar protein FliS|nr:flagellar export chaperone FliS [Bacillota bacterium]
MTANPYGKYQETQVQTAPPETLVLMLYDGAIRFAGQGKADLLEGRRESAHRNLVRAQDILVELQTSLDFNMGEVAFNLWRIYEYLEHRLVEANTKRSSEPIDEVIGMLSDLRQTWAQAIRHARGMTAKTGG